MLHRRVTVAITLSTNHRGVFHRFTYYNHHSVTRFSTLNHATANGTTIFLPHLEFTQPPVHVRKHRPALNLEQSNNSSLVGKSPPEITLEIGKSTSLLNLCHLLELVTQQNTSLMNHINYVAAFRHFGNLSNLYLSVTDEETKIKCEKWILFLIEKINEDQSLLNLRSVNSILRNANLNSELLISIDTKKEISRLVDSLLLKGSDRQGYTKVALPEDIALFCSVLARIKHEKSKELLTFVVTNSVVPSDKITLFSADQLCEILWSFAMLIDNDDNDFDDHQKLIGILLNRLKILPLDYLSSKAGVSLLWSMNQMSICDETLVKQVAKFFTMSKLKNLSSDYLSILENALSLLRFYDQALFDDIRKVVKWNLKKA